MTTPVPTPSVSPSGPPDDATLLAHAGNNPADHHGFVNTPPFRGSTVLFPSTAVLDATNRGEPGGQRYAYGLPDNPSTDALAEAVTALEGPGAVGTVLCPSGLSACTTAILALVGAGEHLLVSDSVYGPVRRFCDTAARRFGIETTYYPPTVGAELADYFRPNTRAVFAESPGSHTLEVQDLPTIVAAARRHGAAIGHDVLVLTDNTWATPLYLKTLGPGIGADVSIVAATKYFVGHSDALLGTVACNARAWARVREFHLASGLHVGPDDAVLTLRGLRTLGVRLARQQASALAVARWLEARPEVARVIHPGLPSHPQHALFRRDFTGSSGLFAFVLRDADRVQAAAFLDALGLFGLGYSWGGYESLAVLSEVGGLRTVVPWRDDLHGWPIRLSIGLEAVDDLLADLDRGFAGLREARGATGIEAGIVATDDGRATGGWA